jgi:hypothetical protein
MLLAGEAPGTAVFSNRIKDASANENGVGGVAMRSFEAGKDLDGNESTHSILGNESRLGYLDGSAGDGEAGINQPVAIDIRSADTSLSGISLSANQISHDHYGIWTENLPAIANQREHVRLDGRDPARRGLAAPAHRPGSNDRQECQAQLGLADWEGAPAADFAGSRGVGPPIPCRSAVPARSRSGEPE